VLPSEIRKRSFSNHPNSHLLFLPQSFINSDNIHCKYDYILESITQQPTSENQRKPPQDVYNNDFDTINTRFPTTEKSLRKYIKNQLDIILQLSRKPDIIFYLAQQCCDKDAIRQNYNDNNNQCGAVNHHHDQLLETNDNLNRQLERYEVCMDLVQQFMLHYPRENVLQLNSIKCMQEYLGSVPLQRIVEPFIVSQPEEQKSLRELCQRHLIHPSYKWKVSDFGERCPVSMQEGQLKQGNIDYAVNYMGTIYMLSSKTAMDSFLQTPDKFLKLQPTCRLVIMGAKLTGKTTLAGLLADLINAVSISASNFSNVKSWRKYERWILDGMTVETKDWDDLLDQQLQPDVVLILQDKTGDVVRRIYQNNQSTKFRDQNFVVTHIRKYFGHLVQPHPLEEEDRRSSSTETLKQEIAQQTIDAALQGVCESAIFEQLLLDYENYLNQINALKLYLTEKRIPYIEVELSVGTWTEVLIDAVSKYLNFFIYPPQEGDIAADRDALLFGQFGEYCPVTLNDRDLLRKGNSLLHVEYRNKSYFFAGEADKRKFLNNPELYVHPVRVPPPRICITGPPKSGKTTVAQLLSEKYGIPAVGSREIFASGLKHYFQQPPYFEKGVVIDGYPAKMEDSAYMAESQLRPDVLLILGATDETATYLEDQIAATFTSGSDIPIELLWKKIDKVIQRFIHRQHVQCTRELDMDNVHELVNAGLFRYSRFQEHCPVTNYELINRRVCCASNDTKITPVLYSDEIYFLRGSQRLKMFRANPKKYTAATNRLHVPVKNKLIVCGPPLSGTSALCGRCAEEYSVPVLKTDGNKELLKLLKSHCQAGWILDNPKLTVELLQTLRECGEEPTAIIVVKADAESLWKSFGKSNKLKTCMVLLAQCFAQRYEQHEDVLQMLKHHQVHRYKNVKFLEFYSSSWKVWNEMRIFVLETAMCISKYERCMEAGKPASLKHLNMSRMEIDARLSVYQYYCPLCYLKDGKLVLYEHKRELEHSIFSKNEFHNNLVQWKQEMFWCCNRHINEFINQLADTDKLSLKLLPKTLPQLVHSYAPDRVTKKGYCVVSSNTIEDRNKCGLSHQKNIKGLPEFAVLYEQKVFGKFLL
jgi:YHS domain-containing protein